MYPLIVVVNFEIFYPKTVFIYDSSFELRLKIRHFCFGVLLLLTEKKKKQERL